MRWNETWAKIKFRQWKPFVSPDCWGSGGGEVGSWAMLQDSSVFFMNCLFTVVPLLGGYHGVHF